MRSIRIDAAACLWWAALLLTLPLPWLLAAFAAGVFHEFCHYLMILAVGGVVEGIRIRPGGAVMEVAPLTPGRELLCALAGPLGGCVLLYFARWFPLVALCGLVQSVFNLLPIFPLDGGRALRCAVMLLAPRKDPEQLCRVMGWICLMGLLGLILLAAHCFSWGCGVLLPMAVLVYRFFPGKRPCKTGRLALQ